MLDPTAMAPALEAYGEGVNAFQLEDAIRAYLSAARSSPAREQVTEAMGGWIPLTVKGDKMTCRMPADETVVEVMLNDGAVCRAWYSCNIMDAGDWDFLPVKDNGEPDDDADSIASKIVAWRSLLSPSPTGGEAGAVGERARDEIMRLMREEFDPHPNYELPAGEWDDNAEDVADKIIVTAISESPPHISDAWRIIKKWLADYAEEEKAFSRYRDDVMLDGIMTAGERRKLSTALAFQCCKGLAPEAECGCASRDAWTRSDLAKGLAMLDGLTLHDIRSTVGDPTDANNWREYLGRADDLLAHLSASICATRAPTPQLLAPEDGEFNGNEEALAPAEAGVAPEIERLSLWMLSHSYATGHGDTIEDLLDELETQITERSRHVDEPEWTARLAHIDQRTHVEKQVADLEYAIEHLGAHPLLTDALNAADLAMRTLGKWYDEGEPGRSTAEPGVEGDAKPVAWMADFTSPLVEAVLEPLLKQWEAFEAGAGNQEEAYYKLAKYARPYWEAARALLTKLQEGE